MNSTVVPQIHDVETIRLIGRGAYGEVWLVRNRPFGALRAAKVIYKAQEKAVVRELAALRQYIDRVPQHHDHLMPIYHSGETSDHLFYLMPAADGIDGHPASEDPGYEPATLATCLSAGALQAEKCSSFSRQLLCGLAALHSRGLVHRDVKPANCIFVDGKLKLADFGLVVPSDRTASFVGTLPYMPPDGQMDFRADIYAVGLVVYEMITGLSVDSFPRWPPMLTRRLREPRISALNRFALKACEKTPAPRFQHADEAIQWLDKQDAAMAVSPSKDRKSKHVKRKGALAIAAVAGLALSVYAFRSGSPPQFKNVNFITRPFEAEVILDGTIQQYDGIPYRTPCTIPHLTERTYHVTFRRANLPDLDVGNIDVRRQDDVIANWP